MKRREFIVGTAGLIGTVLPLVGRGQAKPCPPGTVQVTGGTSVSTACASAPVGATHLAQQASTMSAGQWKQFTTNGLSTSLFVTGANNTLDYMDKGAYDPVNEQIRFVGNGHLEQLRWHQYNEATNTWGNLSPPSWYGGGAVFEHGYQHNTVDPATGDWYYRSYNNNQIRHYTQATGTWSQLPTSGTMEIAGGIEWLPTIGALGGLVFHVGTNIRYWNKATNTWGTGSTNLSGAGPYHNAAVLNRVTNEVYFGGGNGSGKVWKVNAAGTVAAQPDCPATFGIGSAITTVCPTSGHMLVFKGGGTAYRYNGVSWATLSITGAPSFDSVNAGSKIVAVPVAAHGVVLFLFGGTPATWLYKHA